MITRVEALNFRCLRYVHRPMNSFHVLVGPNASGKTTFLDVIGILGDIVSGGLDYALSERTPNPQDLLFGRRGSRLELAVEATVPDALRQPGAQQWNTVRYQVALGYDDTWKILRRWSAPKTAIAIWCTGMLAACPCRPGWSPMAR